MEQFAQQSSEDQRNAIADLLLAQQLAQTQMDYQGHSPTASDTLAPSAPSNTSSLAVHDFAATGPKEGAGNLFSTEEAGGPHSAGSNMFGAPSDPSEPDFGNSGNMFASGFDIFGGQYDPGDPGTAQPNGPADAFGPGAIGNFGTNMTTGTPLGDYSTSPTMNTTPGVPSDPGDPFGNSDQIAEASPGGSFTAGFGQGFAAAANAFGGGDPGSGGADPGGGAGQGGAEGTGGSSSSSGESGSSGVG